MESHEVSIAQRIKGTLGITGW